MKAIVVKEPGILDVVELPMTSDPKADEVIVKIKAAGICGSDMHVYHGTSAFASYPRIIGHELAGEIIKKGSDITQLDIGDHVAIDPVTSCGKCYACRTGRHNVCKNIKVLAAHIDGGFKEYITVKASNAYKISADIPWEHAATTEPYSIAAEAVGRSGLTSDDTVLICGAGPIGLAILQVAKGIGSRTIVLDNLQSRLTHATGMGADLVIDVQNQDPEVEVMMFTQNDGANVIFEATGSIQVMETAISKLVSPAGRVIILGFSTKPAHIAPIDIMKRELDIRGSRLNNFKFPEVITWLEKGTINPSSLITHVFDFTDAQKAFELIENDPGGVIKVILKF